MKVQPADVIAVVDMYDSPVLNDKLIKVVVSSGEVRIISKETLLQVPRQEEFLMAHGTRLYYEALMMQGQQAPSAHA